MKWMLSLILTCFWLSGNVYSQQLTPEEHKQILKALIDRDEALAKVKELTGQIESADGLARALTEKIQAERDIRLSEKKLYLGALIALREYRTTRRPLIVKVISLGMVRDKHDKKLEADIAMLQKEIAGWR